MPSLELYYDRGHYLYGLNMFHQIHCLVSTAASMLGGRC